MRFWRLIFIVWVFFWVFFLARGLYKGEFEEFKALLTKDPDGRRAYVMGEGLYRFSEFSLRNIPKEGTYKIAGELKPLDRCGLIYYLYPRRESDNPEYILCYKKEKTFSERGFYRSAQLKEDQFILKRR